MKVLVVILSFLFGGEKPQTCYSSVFGYEGDALRGGTNVCTKKHMGRNELGVASRTLACGTKVLLVHPRTGRSVVASVVDRGPYGATDDEGNWVLKRKRSDPGKWRGCLDVSRAVQRALEHNGFEKLLYVPLAQR